jgi:hypothetical protein
MHKPHDKGEKDDLLLREKRRSPTNYHIRGWKQGLVKGLGKIAISPDHSISNVFLVDSLDYICFLFLNYVKWATTVFLRI